MQTKYTYVSIKKRFFAVMLAITFFLLALSFRLLYLQVINSQEIIEKAYSQWLRDLPMTAQRGNFVDRNGASIATSYTTYDIYVRHADIESEDSVAGVISNATGLDYDKVLKKVAKRGISEVLVASAQEKEVVNQIIKDYQEGIFFTENTSRLYTYGDLLTQILGFVSSDGNGQSGLEAKYNKYLKGINGVSLVESDIKGTTLSSSLSYYLPAIDGLNIQLTIDLNIQREVEKIIEQAMVENGAKNASAIVMDPENGEILAICTKPSYDLNNVPRDDVQSLLSLSRATAITDVYEPGSTFKVITTAIALNEGVTSEHDYFYCSGFRVVNGVKINCHRRSGHGSQSLEQGLKNSCNCVFMDSALRLGTPTFYDYLRNFGLTKKTGIDMTGETSGIFIAENAVKTVDLARIGFGQAVAVTPIGLITATSSVVNGGKKVVPHLLDYLVSSSGDKISQDFAVSGERTISQSTSDTRIPICPLCWTTADSHPTFRRLSSRSFRICLR